MELRKEQIKHIDSVLEKKGIQYWDLRIEMIDHIVSDMEVNAISNDFEKEFEKALIRINWDRGLSLENKIGWKNVNIRYRSLFKKGLLKFFFSLKNLLLVLVFFCIHYTLSQQLTFKFFHKISLALYIIPILIVLGYLVWLFLKKFGKSVHVNYGIFYFSFSFIMINMVIQFMRYASEDNQKIIWLITLPIYFVAMYTGYTIFKTAIKKVEQIKKELAL